jgi:hypothetical protein
MQQTQQTQQIPPMLPMQPQPVQQPPILPPMQQMQDEIEQNSTSLQPMDFSYNEVMLIYAVFNHRKYRNTRFCKYIGLNAAYRKIGSNHILICYFIGPTFRYTYTRKLQVIQYINNKYVPFNKTYNQLIKSRMSEFYYICLPAIESMIYEFRSNSSGNSSEEDIMDLSDKNDNIFKYRIHVCNGEPKIRYDYDI